MKTKQLECPECEKLTKVADESQKIVYFLDWLSNQGIQLAVFDEGNDGEDIPMWVPKWEYQTDTGINKLLARYFDIDLDKVEQERRAILKWLQENRE